MSPDSLLVILLTLCASRCAVVYSVHFFVLYGRMKNRKLYTIPFREKQNSRELKEPLLGSILDSVILYVIFYLGIFNFVSYTKFSEYIIFILTHVFIVEPIYYWYHRVLHGNYLYKKHHKYHHWSVICTPATSFTFTMLERASYSILFAIPLLIASLSNRLSITGLFVYVILFDIINMIGHLNYEIFPKSYNKSMLKWFLYTPTFHSQHHLKLIKNYSLFMPIYDRLFKTYETDTDYIFHEACNNKPQTKIKPK